MGRLNGTMVICGKDCEECKYSTFDESNKAKIMLYCSRKERWYIYGQCIQCEYKEKRIMDDD